MSLVRLQAKTGANALVFLSDSTYAFLWKNSLKDSSIHN